MIKLNEIRVGNLFTYCNHEEESPFNLSDFISLNEYDLSLEDIKPIKITDKKLCDIGFEKKESDLGSIYEKKINNCIYTVLLSNNEIKNNSFGIRFEDDEYLNKDNLKFFSWNFKYVHELQNLWYDITKEDLIK